MRLFVYGSLLAGEPAHDLLGPEARLIGPAESSAGFELRLVGQYPALVSCEEPNRVHGELYEVAEKRLGPIDDYEGHPEPYRRSAISLADGSEAWTYHYIGAGAAHAPRIASGDWRSRQAATPAPQKPTKQTRRGPPA